MCAKCDIKVVEAYSKFEVWIDLRNQIINLKNEVRIVNTQTMNYCQ